MASCEKCWSDAFLRSFGSSQTQTEAYYELIEERKDNPCSLKEQAGQFWDEEKQIDKRKHRKRTKS